MGEVVALHWTYLLSADQRRQALVQLNKIDLTCSAVRAAVAKVDMNSKDGREVAVVGSEAMARVMNELADLLIVFKEQGRHITEFHNSSPLRS